MQHTLKTWTLRLTATGLLLLVLLVGIILNPGAVYASKTTIGSFSIYHNATLDKGFVQDLLQAHALVAQSELYDATLQTDICLNDGSVYPTLIEKTLGSAFARGFYNKVVLMGTVNNHCLELNNYNWNLTQLLAHELTHCLQYKRFGFWHSNPAAHYPAWKWEGYPEYVARRSPSQSNLKTNIALLLQSEKTDATTWAITFADGSIAPKDYYKDWLLVSYCLDIKKMTYSQLLQDSSSEEQLREEMMQWFHKNKTHSSKE